MTGQGGEHPDETSPAAHLAAAASAGFIHLRVHSAYSLLEGALKPARLVKLCQQQEMPALAIVDRNNLFGALEFSESMAKAGVQPIIGCTLAVDFGGREGPGQNRPRGLEGYASLALLAQNAAGYAGLMKLSSAAFLDVEPGLAPHVGIDLLREHSEGLIVLTGGPEGPVNEALVNKQPDQAAALMSELKLIFGDRLYVELQRHGVEDEQAAEPGLIDLAYDLDLPLVATNQAYFEQASDYEAHDALICIAQGAVVAQSERRRLSEQHYFKSAEEMTALFSDLPEAIANTTEIAARCSFRPRVVERPTLPRFDVPDEAAEMRRQARAGLAQRLEVHGCAEGKTEEDYQAQLEHELDIIENMDFPGYFLIVADFIKWSKEQGIPVGPGRGSGAGSVVAWALTITDLDPLRFGLLFERFLNPERVSMPDFDIDFCQERRDEVFVYVQEKYGHDQVAQIITFGKLQARAVLRDVGRVLQIPYGKVDSLCKMVPNNPANPVTLPQAIEGEPRLREARAEDETVARLLEIGVKLEGLYRHASTHAAGLVIGDRPLAETIPLYRDPRSSMPVTQFNMKWVEPAGLVKFDFLGLKTLTVIDKACQLLRLRGVEVEPARIPFVDPPTYEMLARGDTVGVFQFESAGMRDLMRKAVPTVFEDLIAIVALFRPGPMENIPKYLACKHGQEQPEELHEMIKPVVADTYGVIIYQEQVMQIAQVLSGYSLGEADLLRRAMGKKIKSEMEAQRARFVSGAVANGVKSARAEYIFDLVDKFAGYGFNKSHSAAYALVAYQTAWLKANHPVEFLAASMTLDMANTDKLSMFRQEAERLGIEVMPPDANRSGTEFTVHDGKIFYALAAIRNVGRAAAQSIVDSRENKGLYKDLPDLAARLNPRHVNKRSLENLARAGVFDSLEPNRARIFKSLDIILAAAGRAAANRSIGQNDLFGAGSDSAGPSLVIPEARAWTPMERLAEEFDAIGFYLSGHPLDAYAADLARLDMSFFEDFKTLAREKGFGAGRLAGIVTNRKERKSAKSGNAYAFVGLSDPTGQYEAIVFSDTLAECRDRLEPGRSVALRVEADLAEDDFKLRIQGVRALDEIMQAQASGWRIVMDDTAAAAEMKSRLETAAVNGGRGDEVMLRLSLPGQACEVELKLPGRYAVTPDTAGAIRELPGIADMVQMERKPNLAD